jgi:hypothetical protein
MTVRAVSNNPASPVYNANAPSLTGVAGSLTALLDAVLVNGFTGFTALGWTIGQTTTNKRQYIMAAAGTGNSLWVDDTGPGGAGAREARVCGFATMSATTPTGTGQFPTSAQSSIGFGALVVRKSTTADATVRYWTTVGDGHTIYLFTETADVTNPTAVYGFCFGDFFSRSSTDTSNCIIIGRQVENSNAGGNAGSFVETLNALSAPNTTLLSNTITGHYCAANFTNVGGSLTCGKHSDQTKMGYDNTNPGLVSGWLGGWRNGASALWNTMFAYPNPPDEGLYLAPFTIHHQGNVRGKLKGLWCVLQHMPLGHNDPFTGTDDLAGKSLLCQVLVTGNSSGGAAAVAASQLCVETSDTWN